MQPQRQLLQLGHCTLQTRCMSRASLRLRSTTLNTLQLTPIRQGSSSPSACASCGGSLCGAAATTSGSSTTGNGSRCCYPDCGSSVCNDEDDSPYCVMATAFGCRFVASGATPRCFYNCVYIYIYRQ